MTLCVFSWMAWQLIFWILTGSCITVYCAVLPFNNIASGFIVEKWLEPHANGYRQPTVLGAVFRELL